MTLDAATPWHKASYDAFLNERLPALLAERVPLAGYRVTPVDTYRCRLDITLGAKSGDVEIVIEDIPQPDEDGTFKIGGETVVVVPVASGEDLARADILCVGEQLYAYVEARLGQASPDLPWDAALAEAWLPLATWIAAFMAGNNVAAGNTAQRLDRVNWLARQTHLRRLLVPDREERIHPSELGRVCPFETPEGPNLAYVLTIATGAEIRDGKLVVVDDRPEAALGLSASMIPFLEHDDPNRILMGANMLRQWVVQAQPEQALVQTGNEPDADSFWCGRNLLTAFVSWGAGTFEDGIVVSESCARRFDTPYPLELGDKLSNRHGAKGVVSQILPDDEMPHLPDGTPVDLVFHFTNVHRRMNFGQIREAVMGRIAQHAGGLAMVSPFGAPGEDKLRARLIEAGLPSSGMETLTRSKGGAPLDQPSTVGWVYWGRLHHLAQSKLHTYTSGEWGQVQGEMENFMLRDLGAIENIREGLNTRAVRHPGADDLAEELAAGPVEQAAPPTPLFTDLIRRLRVAGIEADLTDGELAFRFAPSSDDNLKLVHTVPHPWLRGRSLSEISRPAPQERSDADDLWALIAPPGGWYGPEGPSEAYAALVEANERVARMAAGHAPKRLIDDAVAQLESRVQALFDSLLTSAHLRLSERLVFSGRSVLTPALSLTSNEVGLPEEMAWAFFGPPAVRELGGDAEAVATRSERALQALDEVMARSWVIVNRAPTLVPTALLAFHPVRVPGSAIRIHPLICEWLNADFDGDQAAVHLPVTDVAQREAGERLSVAAHLRRDPHLLRSLLPRQDALWGLVWMSREPGGLEEIAELAGAPVAAPQGFVTRDTLAEALETTLERSDVDEVLDRLERLTARGFEVAKSSGASLSPFIETSEFLSPKPSTATPEVWDVYVDEVVEALAAPTDCAPASLGPQCLLARATGQGLEQLAWLIAGRGSVEDPGGERVIVRHGYADGYAPEELFACVGEARRGLAQVFLRWEQMGRTFRQRNVSPSFNVLTRALRAQHPGVVFARAAAIGEVDPLEDVEARLLVGLTIDGEGCIA